MNDETTNRQLIEAAVQRGLDDLFPHDAPGASLSRVRVEHILRAVAERAWADGRSSLSFELRTADQTARALDVTPAYVRRLARRHGIGWNIGRDWLFRPEDVERLRGHLRKSPTPQ